MTGDYTLEAATAAVADPTTTPGDLQAIAAQFPSLRPAIVNHPNAYPDLIIWIANHSPKVNFNPPAAVTVVQPEMPIPSMTPPPQRSGPRLGVIVAIVIVAVAVIVAGGVTVWAVMRQGASPTTPPPVTMTVTQTEQQPASEAPTTPAPTTPAPNRNPVLDTDPPVISTIEPLSLSDLPDLPALSTKRISVKTDGFSAAAIQKLANDVAADNVEKIVNSCWTQPATDLRLVYSSATMRGAILQALTQTGQGAQGGGVWTGKYVTVEGLWEELDSAYACPNIYWDDARTFGLGAFTPAMAQWRMTRILGVHDGKPVHSGDGKNYQLTCGNDCTGLWAPHDPDENAMSNDPPQIMHATAAQWNDLRILSQANIEVDVLSNGYYRVGATDGSTSAVAYFTSDYTDFWVPFLLGEIA